MGEHNRSSVASILTETEVLDALHAVHQREGRATVRAIGAEAGLHFNTAHSALQRLAQRGQVIWDTGHKGTLRPATPPSTGPEHPLRPIWDQCAAWDLEVDGE